VLRKRRDGLQITAGASALTGRDGGAVAVPHGEAVERDLLGWLQALPGFDNEQVVEAMTCAEDAIPRVLGHNRTATWAGSSHTKPRD
jgi:hypothetical protein